MHRGSISCFAPSSPRFDSLRSQKFILVLLIFINVIGERKLGRGMIMLIEPI